MDSIKSELESEIKRLNSLAKFNYRAAYILSAIAVLASIFAGLSVAVGWFRVEILAVMSSLPGAILIILDRLKFEERSNWHYRKLNAIKGLLYQLKFEGKSDAEISAEWRRITNEEAGLWPGFGRGDDPKRAEPPRLP